MSRLKAWAAHLNSWLQGLEIGQLRYVKAKPFMLGNVYHFLPTDCWSEKEIQALRFNIKEQRWDGWKWVYVRHLVVERDKAKALLMGETSASK